VRRPAGSPAWQPTGVPAPLGRSWHEDVDVVGPVAEAARTLCLDDKYLALTLPDDPHH
jgi:hypothetical protein